MEKQVVVLIGAGSIGQAIARRVGIGKHVLLADLKQENLNAAKQTLMQLVLKCQQKQLIFQIKPQL